MWKGKLIVTRLPPEDEDPYDDIFYDFPEVHKKAGYANNIRLPVGQSSDYSFPSN